MLFCLVDVVIYSPTLEQHIIDVRNVLKLLSIHKLYIKIKEMWII